MDSTRPLILHFTAALGGGLEAVIHDYVRSAPEYDHQLLFARRGEFAIGRVGASAVPARAVEPRPADLLRGVRAAIDELSPSVLHLHSVTAGVIGRIGAPLDVAVAYTPHSYFHERGNLPRAVRTMARTLEGALRPRTDLVIAVSPFEAATAVSMGIPATFVPNVAQFGDQPGAGSPAPCPQWDVVGSGRLSAQKDPLFFAEVKRVVDRVAPGLRWGWLGGGDERMRQTLEQIDIRVSGWLPRESVLAQLSMSRTYLHTAAWEGNPVSLLEVQHLGVPAVARSIPALVSLGHAADLVTPEQVAAGLLDELAGTDGSSAGHGSLGVETGTPTAADQRVALEGAYARVRELRDVRITRGAGEASMILRRPFATRRAI